jgi:hypothetical protein
MLQKSCIFLLRLLGLQKASFVLELNFSLRVDQPAIMLKHKSFLLAKSTTVQCRPVVSGVILVTVLHMLCFLIYDNMPCFPFPLF